VFVCFAALFAVYVPIETIIDIVTDNESVKLSSEAYEVLPGGESYATPCWVAEGWDNVDDIFVNLC
jgi:hypothetical protein